MKATRRSQTFAALALLSILVSLGGVPTGTQASAKAGGGARYEALAASDAAAGAGVVEGLARRIAAGDVPASLRGKKLFRLDAGRMLGEAGGEEFARRFASVLSEAKSSGGRVVLFLENLDGLLSAREAQAAQSALDSL